MFAQILLDRDVLDSLEFGGRLLRRVVTLAPLGEVPAERRVLNRADEDLKTFGWSFLKLDRE